MKKDPTSISLLEYPWIFGLFELVDLFRALCLRRMETAVEECSLNLRLLCGAMGPMASLSMDPHIRELMNGTLRKATHRFLPIRVSRHRLADDLFDQLWRRERRELLRPLRVEIQNEGEEGLDQGGVSQELFQSALYTLLDPEYGQTTLS